MENPDKVIEEFKQRTMREYIELSAEPADDMTVYQSKFGGTPYMPKGFVYPFSKLYQDKPLKLLAQINFAEMPKLEDFPEKGILQIYIEPEDDRFFGCDDRIRYFEKKQGYIPYSYEDEDFKEIFLEIYSKYSDEEVEELEGLFDVEDIIGERKRHKIGGYQNDVWDAKWKNTDVLLLQIVSCGSIEIGDSGIAHFTMTRDDLKAGNFSNVKYSWECC